MTEAVLLVGGQGTRLRPLTINTPKPMLPVAGVPFTEHQIARAREAGVTRVVLGTSYRAEVFRDYFGDGAKFGVELVYAVEDQPLGTGGAIRQRRRAPGVRARRPGAGVQRRRPDRRRPRGTWSHVHAETKAAVTLYLTRVERSAGVRPRAHRRRRPGDGLPGEAEDRRGDRHRPDQRRLLRVPPLA